MEHAAGHVARSMIENFQKDSPGDRRHLPRFLFPRQTRILIAAIPLLFPPAAAQADTLDSVRNRGEIVFGTDSEGGAPYLFPDPENSSRIIGFEKELMDQLGQSLGLRAVHNQESWDRLLQVLETGRVDVVCNGLELTPERSAKYLATRPYFVYQLQLLGKRGAPLRAWDDFLARRPDGRIWRIGVLTGSVADRYLHDMVDYYNWKSGQLTMEAVRRDSVVDALREIQNGQLDATLQDDLAARFYLRQADYGNLRAVGPPQGGGYYVIYLRQGDHDLHQALDQGIKSLLDRGVIRRIYEKYDLWSPAQEELLNWDQPVVKTTRPARSAWEILGANQGLLIRAAAMTLVLSCASMPLAMLIGLGLALMRMYGPWPLRLFSVAYVEFIRGTPLLMQLFFLYFLLPIVGISLHEVVAGIIGLAINYSAYEAEIYRTGLQAVPGSQMEAALALGMPRSMAIRRIILPQAIRIVIPPVTSDFITLLKDSSVCSMIGIVELSLQYKILVNNNGHVVMFAAIVAAIYLAMSLPLARLTHRLEEQLRASQSREGVTR
jgi:polar amino acid transport system substrate-binding protein